MIDRTKNAVKEAAAKKGVRVRGVHLTFPSAHVIEVLAGTGLDFIYLDGEHGAFDRNDIAECCRAIEHAGLTAIARLPDTTVATITHFLDRGVRGLILPHIETVVQAKAIVQAAYFAPLGQRSYGAGRPEFGISSSLPAAEYLAICNRRTSVSLMIESAAGLAAVSEIAAIEGVDYLSFGMFDLAQSLGYPGEPNHPEVKSKVDSASEKVRALGKPIREDFIEFVWINEVIKAGRRALLPDG